MIIIVKLSENEIGKATNFERPSEYQTFLNDLSSSKIIPLYKNSLEDQA